MGSELRRGEWKGRKKGEAALGDKGCKGREPEAGEGSGAQALKRGASSQAGSRE